MICAQPVLALKINVQIFQYVKIYWPDFSNVEAYFVVIFWLTNVLPPIKLRNWNPLTVQKGESYLVYKLDVLIFVPHFITLNIFFSLSIFHKQNTIKKLLILFCSHIVQLTASFALL